MSFYSDEGPALVSARLRVFFDQNSRFIWEDQIGGGANGIVYQLRYENERKIAVKVCPLDVKLEEGKAYDEEEDIPDEVQSLTSELQWLQVSRSYSMSRSCPINNQLIEAPEL